MPTSGVRRAAADRRDRHDVEGHRSSLWHLATHADDRRRLVAEPALIPTAVEEFFGPYAPVTMARFVAKDHDFHGHPMKEGDWVLLPFPAANRDPGRLRQPTTWSSIAWRTATRRSVWASTGVSGRTWRALELRVAIEEFLARIPDFGLADPSGESVAWSVGQIRGPRVLPLRSPDQRCILACIDMKSSTLITRSTARTNVGTSRRSGSV